MLDLRVIDISYFDVILGLDWLTTHLVSVSFEVRGFFFG